MIEMTDIQNEICAQLIRLKSVDRDRLCEITEMPRTTLFDNLKRLEKLGIVQKSNGPSQGRGRPKVYWSLNKERVRVKSI